MSFATALTLTLLGVVARLAPHPPNAVAIGALALYAGARLPRVWAFAVPILAMLLSDVLLDWGKGYSLLEGSYLVRYATFALVVAIGTRAKGPVGITRRFELSLLASTLFFVTSNWAVWAFPFGGHPPMFPKTLGGLGECYVAAIPFFGNTIVADLMGTCVLFGLDALANQLAGRRRLGTVSETVTH
jgi:hypothetical protein